MQFKPEQIIYSENEGASNCVHFVLSGKCCILQCLKMKVRMRNGRPKYELMEIESDENKDAIENDAFEIVHRFIDVGSLSCGSVFALGENMQHRTIVARNNVQCLLIPRHWILQKQQNPANIWIRYEFSVFIYYNHFYKLFL